MRRSFVDNFAAGIRRVEGPKGLTLTTLMPGATDTDFFERAEMMDTKVWDDEERTIPPMSRRTGWDALMAGRAT